MKTKFNKLFAERRCVTLMWYMWIENCGLYTIWFNTFKQFVCCFTKSLNCGLHIIEYIWITTPAYEGKSITKCCYSNARHSRNLAYLLFVYFNYSQQSITQCTTGAANLNKRLASFSTHYVSFAKHNSSCVKNLSDKHKQVDLKSNVPSYK